MKGIILMDLLSSDLETQLSAMADEQAEMLRKLYPPLPDNYFADKPDALVKEPTNPLSRIYRWYDSATVKPYAKITNLNTTKEGETEFSPKPAAEIGISFSF